MVTPPQAAELRAQMERWEWFPKAWNELDAQSRRSYDDWVLQSRSSGQAQRRAVTVSRRCFTARPWAGCFRRRLDAIRDSFSQAPNLPDVGSPYP